MAYDYSSFEALAIRQIADKGRNVTYRSIEEGVYDKDTGAVSGNTYTDTIVKALEVRPRFNQYTKLDPTIGERFDKEYMIAADVISPKQKDKIIDEGVEYQIVKINRTQPGDTPIYYNFRVKK